MVAHRSAKDGGRQRREGSARGGRNRQAGQQHPVKGWTWCLHQDRPRASARWPSSTCCTAWPPTLNTMSSVEEVGRRHHRRAAHDHRLPQLPRVPAAAQRSHPARRSRSGASSSTSTRQETLEELVTEIGEGHDGLGRRTPHLAAHAERAGGRVRGPDRGHRRHRRIDAPGAHAHRGARRRRDRAVEPGLRQVRPRRPTPAGGAGPACRRRLPERHAARARSGRRLEPPRRCWSCRRCSPASTVWATSSRKRSKPSRHWWPARRWARTSATWRRATSGRPASSPWTNRSFGLEPRSVRCQPSSRWPCCRARANPSPWGSTSSNRFPATSGSSTRPSPRSSCPSAGGRTGSAPS